MKTTKELKFDSLYTSYAMLKKVLGEEKANEQFEVIFNELVKDCAEQLYEGDVNNIVLHKALYNNLVSDKRTRFADPDKYGYVQGLSLKQDFVELLNSFLPAEKRSVPKKKGAANKEAKWKYEEQDVLAIKNVDDLKKFISSIGTAKARSVEAAMVEFGLSEEQVIERFDALRATARKQIAILEGVQLSDNLVDKLQAGKKTTLSAAEIAELVAALSKKA